MRRSLVMVLVLSVVAAAGPSAMAHPPTSFHACAKTGDACLASGAAYTYGDTVRLRGVVTPPHKDNVAQVWRKRPGEHVFHRVGTVPISDEGRMYFAWHTHKSDAFQNKSYSFFFRIADHGRSNKVVLFVLFGE